MKNQQPTEQRALAKLDSATRMLAEVHDAPSAKHVMDLADAAKIFARKAKLGEEAVRLSNGIKLDAERKLGSYLAQQPKAPAGRPRKIGSTSAPISTPPTLAELGITKKLSAEAQQLAAIDDATFEHAKARGAPSATVAQLAKLPKAKRLELVESDKPLRAGNIRSKAAQEKKRETIAKINKQQVRPMPVGPFRVLLIDPPWEHDNSDNHEGSRGHTTYPTMPLDEIANLAPDLDKLAHPDGCILFTWFPNTFMHKIGYILSCWEFDYRTTITWDKILVGLGTWPRGQTEHVTISTRGKPVHTLNEISTLFAEKRREHSRKPERLYEIIEKHCSGPYVELFAREERKNWASWGAEVGKFKAA